MDYQPVNYRKPKPMPGHKCLGAFRLFETACECGWYSTPDRERSVVYLRWREHMREHGAEFESFDEARARETKERKKLARRLKPKNEEN